MNTSRILDQTDWNIIAELEADARQSFSALGRKVGLSQSATADRVKCLEAAGVIKGYRVDIDREKLGYPITAIISIDSNGEKCHGLQRNIAKLPEVIECHRVTGEGSYILRAALQNVSGLEALIDRLLAFGSPTTSIVLSTPLPARNIAPARAVEAA